MPLFLVFLQGCRGCWEKEQEQEITITLQTEKPTETTVAPPVVPIPPKKEAFKPPVVKQKKESPQKVVQSTPPPPVSLSPPVQGDDAKIRDIIGRQKRAFETKDIDLYISDLAAASDKDSAAVGKFFDKYDSIHVDFNVESLSLTGDKAQVTMIQETRLKPKGRDTSQESRVRVLWGLVKKGDTWKIAEFRRLEEIH